MSINLISMEQALEILGQLLSDRGSQYEVVAIGGGGLLLLGLISRPTRDLDLVALVEGDELISADPLPINLVQAIEDTGAALKLGKDWVNIGPASLLKAGLPEGFKGRMETRRFGGITLHLASRLDQICFKLYATIDQGPKSKHYFDLKELNPTVEELQFANKWCSLQDVSECFKEELERAIATLGIQNVKA